MEEVTQNIATHSATLSLKVSTARTLPFYADPYR